MTDRPSQTTARNDIIVLATMSFSAGVMLMVAIYYFIRGDWIAWGFAGCVVMNIGVAFVLGRRALRKIS